MSGPLVTISVLLLPASALVATISGQVVTIRVRVSPARALVATISGPLATIRALRLTMRRIFRSTAGRYQEFDRSAASFSSSREDKIEPMRPRSTVRRDGLVIAQGRQTSGDVKTRRHESRHRAEDGRRFV